MENLKRSWKVMELEELKRVGTLKMNLSVLRIGGYMEGRVKRFLCFKRGKEPFQRKIVLKCIAPLHNIFSE